MPAKKKTAKTRNDKFTEQAEADIENTLKTNKKLRLLRSFKSAKTRSNKLTEQAEADIEKAIKTNKKLHLELQKVKKIIPAIPYRYRH